VDVPPPAQSFILIQLRILKLKLVRFAKTSIDGFYYQCLAVRLTNPGVGAIRFFLAGTRFTGEADSGLHLTALLKTLPEFTVLCGLLCGWDLRLSRLRGYIRYAIASGIYTNLKKIALPPALQTRLRVN